MANYEPFYGHPVYLFHHLPDGEEIEIKFVFDDQYDEDDNDADEVVEIEVTDDDAADGILSDTEIPFCDFPVSKPIFHFVPEIKEIARNGRSTTIHWADGSKTTVKLQEGEKYDDYAAFTAAVCKKLYGSTTACKRLSKRLDASELKRRKDEERALAEAEARRKREKKENAAVKRLAREIALQRRAEKLADEMIKKEGA